jgi:predicted type IV restriction endonuclease
MANTIIDAEVLTLPQRPDPDAPEHEYGEFQEVLTKHDVDIAILPSLKDGTQTDEASLRPVMVITAEPAIPPTATKKLAAKVGPKWEQEARERLRAALRKYTPPLQGLVERDANEGDTRLLVTDFLCDALGYDKYSDLTTEYQVKGEFADYGVRSDKELVAFIEVKRVATKLDARHLRQVEMYAVNEGVEWIILTNGAHWKVYHITGGLPIIIDLAMDVNILSEEPAQQKVNQLFYLTRDALKRRLIDELWVAKRATSPKSLAAVASSPAVVAVVLKELKRKTGYSADLGEVTKLIRTTVIRPECFEKS